MNLNPLIKYGEALVRFNTQTPLDVPLQNAIIAEELEKSLSDFRVAPHAGNVAGSTAVSYRFGRIEKGAPEEGVFLGPNVMATDKSAGNTWKAVNKLIDKLRNSENNPVETAQMSFMPVSGEFLSFGSSGAVGRGKSSLTLQEAAFAAITTLTRFKPALHYRKINEAPVNTALIPDLPPELLELFLGLWKELYNREHLVTLTGGRQETVSGNKVAVKLKRPTVFSGNFPGAPRSSALCGLSLLASLGEAARHVVGYESHQYDPVLDALATAPVYMVQYGNANVFHFNHYVVDMAKEEKLRPIIDCVYYSRLYNVGARNSKNTKTQKAGKATTEEDNKAKKARDYAYQSFDLFYSRFLHLFSESAFKDFMSFRAEYPKQILPLFRTYFINQYPNTMEKIPSKVVDSAVAVGNWLNRQAYIQAVSELEEKEPWKAKTIAALAKAGKEFKLHRIGNQKALIASLSKEEKESYYAELDKIKFKFLVGVESLIFSAKKGHDIVGQLAVTVGRAVMEDFPKEGEIFFKSTATGETTPQQAQNLLMAFSRISTRDIPKSSPKIPEDSAAEPAFYEDEAETSDDQNA